MKLRVNFIASAKFYPDAIASYFFQVWMGNRAPMGEEERQDDREIEAKEDHRALLDRVIMFLDFRKLMDICLVRFSWT